MCVGSSAKGNAIKQKKRYEALNKGSFKIPCMLMLFKQTFTIEVLAFEVRSIQAGKSKSSSCPNKNNPLVSCDLFARHCRKFGK